MKRKILIVDDDQSMCEVIDDHLTMSGFQTVWHTSAENAFLAFKDADFDVVLTDLRMPGVDGLGLCDRIVSNYPDVPIVVFTAFGSMETAVAAMRAGAYDFVTKPIEMNLLTLVVERALGHRVLKEKVRTLREAAEKTANYDQLLGSSPAMKRLFDQLSRIADSDVSVLITGESGTGKELVARALHRNSPRCKGPFVAINCAAMPDTLIESELFGHVRGAYTGANTAHKGMFIEAENGTLLLDEIGELPLALQPKLLRALEEQTIRPIGGDKELSYEARVLASTNRDLETAVEEGRFREDLYYRINVIQIDLPPLRARGTDILSLAQHFVELTSIQAAKKVKGISEVAAGKLLDYKWPGNVRELRNAIARAVTMTRLENVSVEDLPPKIRSYQTSQVLIEGENPEELVPLEEIERRYILHVLKSLGENRTMAAKVLGLDRKTLYRKLKRYSVIEK